MFYAIRFSDVRIIPARAGFTQPGGDGAEALEDHPRSRGVYGVWYRSSASIPGSSPLARGLPLCETGENAGVRIIPARAGFTL